MFEESMSIPEIWASMNSWFTPTVLFVLLNIMIGTIAVTSGLTSQQKPQQNSQQKQQDQDEKSMEDSYQQRNLHQQQQQQQYTDLNRVPSVLQRLKSINFYAYSYRSQDPISIPAPDLHTHEVNRLSSHTHVPEQEKAHTFDEEPEHPLLETEQPPAKTMDEVYRSLQGSHNRTKSDTVPASGDIPVRLPRKMKKSASTKSAFAHFEEEDIVEARRPATVRESSSKLTSEDGDDDEDDGEVDAKADDFINRFKNQLKMQRLESIVRYKELVNREKK